MTLIVATPTRSRARIVVPPQPDRATDYARSVVSGKTVAGKLVRIACQRHLDDMRRTDMSWNAAKSEKALDFFKLVRHYKGQWAGEIITPEPWQCFVIGSLFGWYHPNGRRRYRRAFIEVGKKNGKTLVAGVIGILRAFFDGEAGAEVYSAATKRDQAKLLWLDAKEMVRRSPDLRARISVQVGRLFDARTASVFRPLGADTDSEDGLNPSTALIDEIHRLKNRDLIDWMSQSFGARQDPLLAMITTAGAEGESVWAEEHDYAAKVLEGTITDESLFAYVANLDEGDDPFDESVWVKANPNLGVSVSWEDMRQKALEAREKPSTLPTFLRLRLNVRADTEAHAFPLEVWDASAGELEIKPGDVCYGGLDLSRKRDLSAFVLAFPRPDGVIDLLCRFWMPDEAITERERQDRVPYRQWADEGLLTLTEGNVTDYDVIRSEVIDLCRTYQVQDIAYDPAFATQLAVQLTGDGAEMMELVQTFTRLTEPSQLLESAIVSRKLHHGGNRVLRWMAGNLVWDTDPQGFVKPSKKKSRERIDGISATVMALSRYVAHLEPEPVPQIW